MVPPGGEMLMDLISSLLAGMRCSLTSRAIATMTGSGLDEAEEALRELEGSGSVRRSMQYHVRTWICSEDCPEIPGPAEREKWERKLREYVRFSPGTELPELLAALRLETPQARERAQLLIRAMHQTREQGEFRLLSHLLGEIMELPPGVMTLQEIRAVLLAFQPRRLRGLDIKKAYDFIRGNMKLLDSPLDRIAVFLRMGELELLENRTARAEEHLGEALTLCLENGSGEFVSEILESLTEIPMDFQGMNRTADEIEKVVQWLPELESSDIMVRGLASASVALAHLKRKNAAENTLLMAMRHVSDVSLETQLALEWCRTRVSIESGRKKVAMTMLQRSLLLAQSAGDQLAVMEILNTMIREMKERPGYSARQLISIMRNVSRDALSSGSLSNRLFTLEYLSDLYTRTLQVSEAMETVREAAETAGTSELLAGRSYSLWCSTYLGFLTGREWTRQGDEMLPGTVSFLESLAGGASPEEGARDISAHLSSSFRDESATFAIFMAMEAYARGHSEASSMIARALDSSYLSCHENPFLSWKLCISGILASDDRCAEDFFSSAQVLARQLDRILLVWLLLRCRLSLDIERTEWERYAILLLCSELDRYISLQLSPEDAARFQRIAGADGRMEELEAAAGPNCRSLEDICRVIGEMRRKTGVGRLEDMDSISGKVSFRSEISASLEITGRLMEADRVMVIRVTAGKVSIVEGYGHGGWQLPGIEAEEELLKMPRARVLIENFGRTPFGSRRCLLIPMLRPAVPTQRRTMEPGYSDTSDFLLIERDSPFESEVNVPPFILDSLCRQVASALMLRNRESMAYIDRQTGSVIGSSWTERLQQQIDGSGKEHPVSLLLLDVDGMADINGNFGYSVGDSILKSIVSALEAVLRPNDMIGRVGGDIFGVILPETGAEDAGMIAERICGYIAGSEIRPDRIPVTVTIGFSSSCGESLCTLEMLMGSAAGAMMSGKEQGGNRAVFRDGGRSVDDSGYRLLYNTGDPGWDNSISMSVMELLSVEGPSLDFMAGKLRDALRSNFVYIESGSGASAMVGSRILRKISGEIPQGEKGKVCTHPELLGKYRALSFSPAGGGRLISVWEGSGDIPRSTRNVFRSLANLSGLFIFLLKESR